MVSLNFFSTTFKLDLVFYIDSTTAFVPVLND